MSTLPRLSAACLLFAGLAALPAQAAERRPITPQDLWAMERVANPVVSPDGRWVVFSVTRYSVEENKGNGDLWLVPTDGSAPPRRLTWNEGADGSPAWSPDGQRIAFVSKRGDLPPQLYLLPVGGGEAQPVTKLPVGVQSPKWFPDGKRIAVMASTWPDLNDDWDAVKKRVDEQKNDKTQAKISDSRVLRFWDEYHTDARRNHIFAVDLESGKAQDLTPGLDHLMDFQSADSNWDLSPDGKEIAYSANATDPPYQHLNADVYIQPVDKPGAARDITAANPADDSGPRYSPDGRYILYGRGRRPEIDPDFTRLARYDRKSGAVQGLFEEWDNAPGDWTFTPDGQTVVFHAESRGRVNIYALPVSGGTGEPRLVASGGTTAGAEVAPGADGSPVVVFTRTSMLQPAELYAVPLAGGEPRALSSFNAERIAQLDLGTTDEATFTGAAGDKVQMFLAFPPGFDAKRKWPLVQVIHGGPYGAWQDEFHYRWNAPLFASPGYVVAMVNFHGSTGFGQAFAESILGSHGDKPFTDIMKATDYLIAQGYVDPKRMAAAGGSYGGYMIDWILGHTDRFAALISHAGVYDLMAQFASDGTWGRQNNYGGAPWTDPARVDLWSPSRFAKSFVTPTLILHGEKDYRVPVTQGINLYGVLQGKGVPARIVIFPDENHWVTKPQDALLWWKEVFAWLDHYIGGGAGKQPVAKAS
ncbi:MAG TPA: S9 family peptidase [Thermoanaerobaculia bacterium]|nr:S9 family peptidase [Thermoanaerobaculia bacterium]